MGDGAACLIARRQETCPPPRRRRVRRGSEPTVRGHIRRTGSSDPLATDPPTRRTWPKVNARRNEPERRGRIRTIKDPAHPAVTQPWRSAMPSTRSPDGSWPLCAEPMARRSRLTACGDCCPAAGPRPPPRTCGSAPDPAASPTVCSEYSVSADPAAVVGAWVGSSFFELSTHLRAACGAASA